MTYPVLLYSVSGRVQRWIQNRRKAFTDYVQPVLFSCLVQARKMVDVVVRLSRLDWQWQRTI